MPDASPLTPAQLKIVFPSAADSDLAAVAAEINARPAACGLDTSLRRAHFFAQVRQEAGPGLDELSENLNYSPAALAQFGYYKARPQEAQTDGYVRDPVTRKITRPARQQDIANKAYANRIGNGDVASGDGWRFRGRGCIQVTGRANYAAISAQCRKIFGDGATDYVASPDTLAMQPGAIRSAVGYWVLNGLPQLADKGATDADVDRITAVVNKATDSYADRRANFALARGAFK